MVAVATPWLAGAGFGDDARLAHAQREQDLAEAIVDLVRAGVVELVTLEVDFRRAEVLGQALGEIERRGAAHIMGPEVLHRRCERRVGLGLAISALEIEHERHQGLGDEPAAIGSKTASASGRSCQLRRASMRRV